MIPRQLDGALQFLDITIKMNKTTISSTFPVRGSRNAVIIKHFSHQYPTLHQYTNYSYKFHVTWLKESKRDPAVNLRIQFLTIEKKKGSFATEIHK
jgi:hypothetical protein